MQFHKMRSRISMTACALMAGLVFTPSVCLAQTSSSNYKVLASEGSGFNVSTVQKLLNSGDAFVSKGNLVKAKENYDKARKVSKQLLSFYRTLGGSFRGLDARIPREMDSKSREVAKLYANVNLRLASVFRRQNKPEVAVPVLVEVVKLMTPAKIEGQKAYQSLLELGFVDTPYAAARKDL